MQGFPKFINLNKIIAISLRYCQLVLVLTLRPVPGTSNQSEGCSSKWLTWLMCREPLIMTFSIALVSSPDPTLEEGKGSGEFGHNPWARERNLSAPMRLQL